MQNNQTKTIGGRDYTVSQLPATKAVLVLHRIGKAVGPAIARAISAVGGSLPDSGRLMDFDLSNLDGEKFAEAISGLFRDLPEVELQRLIRDLLETCTYEEDGKTQLLMKTFDVAMQGRLLELFQVLTFAFEVNFGNFSAALAAFVPKRRAAPASPEPTT